MLDSRPTFPTSNTVDRRSKWQRLRLNHTPGGLITQRAAQILINSPYKLAQKRKPWFLKPGLFRAWFRGGPPLSLNENLLIKSYF